MKKILVNGYSELNLGDDLFFKILFDRYVDKEVSWKLVTWNKKYRSMFKSYKNVDIKNRNNLHRILMRLNLLKSRNVFINFDELDALVMIGGSIFIQRRYWEKSYNQDYKEIKYLNENNKPTFILGSNFGPYKDDVFVEKYKYIFNICKDVCFREKYSFDLFKKIPTVRQSTDVIYTLKYNKIPKIKNSLGISIINLEKREGLSNYYQDYCLKHKEIIEQFCKKNYKIKLFSFCEREGDLNTINKIKSMVDKKFLDKIDVVSYNGDIDKFLKEFQSMEKIVACRFHSIILAQVFGQDVYPLIYSNKSYNILKDSGINFIYKDIREISSLNVSNIEKEFSNFDSVINELKEKAEGQFKVLDKFIDR